MCGFFCVSYLSGARHRMMVSERGNAMGSEGKILVRVSAAENAIPLEGVTVVITRRGSGAVLELLARTPRLCAMCLGLRSTNADGQTTPVPVSTPDRELSESPSGEKSWSSVDITANTPGYERVIVENVQVFSGVTTIQDFALIPLEDYPDQWSKTEVFDVTPQEL